MRRGFSAIVCATLVIAGQAVAEPQPALGPLDIDTPALLPAEARALRNPVPNTVTSINLGRTLFGSNGCDACHGADGQAPRADDTIHATNLTRPDGWRYGTGEGQIFRSIRDGAGVVMLPFKTQITTEEEVWHLVNFIRSLWPDGQRPAVREEG